MKIIISSTYKRSRILCRKAVSGLRENKTIIIKINYNYKQINIVTKINYHNNTTYTPKIAK